VVHGPFLFPSLKEGGRQLIGVEAFSAEGGGAQQGGRGLVLTPDVTGHVWRLRDRLSPERLGCLGRGGGSRAERRCHGAPP